MSDSLILPGHPLFDLTLATPPPDWGAVAERHNTWSFIADSESGILRVATPKELEDYLYGGEYDEAINRPVWDDLNEEWLYPVENEEWEEDELF